MGRRDFTAVAAVDGPHLAGFAYGYTDTVCAGLDPASTAVHEAFEVIELAVATFYRSRGIGRARPDGAPARAGISPAHAGFATASLTRIRLAARWQPPLPRMRLRGSSHGHRGLAWATGHGAWPAAATGLLAVAGAGYGAGFGARVQRTVGAVPAAHAPSGVQRHRLGPVDRADCRRRRPSAGTLVQHSLQGVKCLCSGALRGLRSEF